MATRTAVSLFSAGGGLDYGLACAGFQTRLAVEHERYACQVLRDAKEVQHALPGGHAYLHDCEIWQGDIADLTDQEALALARLQPGEATLVHGGPPCVTFSVAGRREGLTSETGRLYEHYVRLLGAFAPEAFIFENVKGLLTAQGPDGEPSAFEMILHALQHAGPGYATTWRVIDAADYGVPQHRERVIILGRRGRRPFTFPHPTHIDPECAAAFPSRQPWRTVRDAFQGLPSAVLLRQQPHLLNHVSKRHSDATVESYRATAPGTRNQSYKRDKLLWDAPGKTVRAQGKPKADGSGQKNSSHQAIHPDEPRQITPRECARLQTFPDWYPFPATLVNAYRIIGDAVPCELARVLGESIIAQLDADAGTVPDAQQRDEVACEMRSERGYQLALPL